MLARLRRSARPCSVASAASWPLTRTRRRRGARRLLGARRVLRAPGPRRRRRLFPAPPVGHPAAGASACACPRGMEARGAGAVCHAGLLFRGVARSGGFVGAAGGGAEWSVCASAGHAHVSALFVRRLLTWLACFVCMAAAYLARMLCLYGGCFYLACMRLEGRRSVPRPSWLCLFGGCLLVIWLTCFVGMAAAYLACMRLEGRRSVPRPSWLCLLGSHARAMMRRARRMPVAVCVAAASSSVSLLQKLFLGVAGVAVGRQDAVSDRRFVVSCG